jgi:hypothetical protein
MRVSIKHNNVPTDRRSEKNNPVGHIRFSDIRHRGIQFMSNIAQGKFLSRRHSVDLPEYTHTETKYR